MLFLSVLQFQAGKEDKVRREKEELFYPRES